MPHTPAPLLARLPASHLTLAVALALSVPAFAVETTPAAADDPGRPLPAAHNYQSGCFFYISLKLY